MNEKEALIALEREIKFMTSTQKRGRRNFILGVPLLLASCAKVPKTRHREGDNTGQEVSLSVSDERRMTEEYLPKMSKDYPTLRNNYAQSYIKNLGDGIVAIAFKSEDG